VRIRVQAVGTYSGATHSKKGHTKSEVEGLPDPGVRVRPGIHIHQGKLIGKGTLPDERKRLYTVSVLEEG